MTPDRHGTAEAAGPFIDAAGAVHRPAGPGCRIVSLVPSLTELLFALGLGPQVVGRTHYCVHPRDAVAALPSVGGTKKIRMDRLLALRPTHVLVNIDETPKPLAEAIAAAGIAVVVTHPNDPLDNPPLYRLLGGIFGRPDAAAALSARFAAAHEALRRQAAGWPPRRVLYLIWRAPWMTVSRDTYIARTLALVGWQTVAHDPALRYPQPDIGPALLRDTDIVLFSTEPYRFTAADLDAFRAEHPCKGTALALIDGEMLSWYGSRAIAGLDYLGRFAAQFAPPAPAAGLPAPG